MRKLLKTGAVLLFAGVALLGAGSLDARAGQTGPGNHHTDGWWYYWWDTSGDDGITVGGYDGPDEDVTVPKILDGHRVTGVTDLLDASFSGKVKSLTIPETVEEINPEDGETYMDCMPWDYYVGKSMGTGLTNSAGLERYEVSPQNPYYQSRDGVLFSKDGKYLVHYPPQKKDLSYEVPKGVTVICHDAFLNNNYLRSVTLPSSVARLGTFGYGCGSLRDLYVPPSVKWLGEIYGSVTIHCQKGSRAEETARKEDLWYRSYDKMPAAGSAASPEQSVRTPEYVCCGIGRDRSSSFEVDMAWPDGSARNVRVYRGGKKSKDVVTQTINRETVGSATFQWIHFYAKKAGTYRIKFDLYAGESRKESREVAVRATETGSAISAVTVDGKNVLKKGRDSHCTSKSAAKVKFKLVPGCKIKKITAYYYDKRGSLKSKKFKNGKKAGFSKYSYDNYESGVYWSSGMWASTSFAVDYTDKSCGGGTRTAWFTIYRKGVLR